MREPNPHNSSFLYNTLYKQSPYDEWIQLTKTKGDLEFLLRTFHVIPKEWLIWVDKRIELSENRGYKVYKPLEYRLNTLWNGIILLQETKYICDVLENAIRQLIVNHIDTYELTYQDFSEFVYRWKKVIEKYESNNHKITNQETVSQGFLVTLSFHQLTEIVYSGWTKVSSRPEVFGFGNYFRHIKHCRDLNVFRNDMNIIRKNRNSIAHSHKLFSKDEAQNLFEYANKWLVPVGVNLSEKVVTYRAQRPKFLQELIIKGSNKPSSP